MRWTRCIDPLGRRALFLALALAFALPAMAGPREQARRIHDRLAGVPPDEPTLVALTNLVTAGDAVGAAYLAMDHPAFYNVSLKNWIAPWTNVDRSAFVDLNDYTATVIGMIRDDHPFDEVLSANLVYVGAAGAASVGYSQTDNDHYIELEQNRVDLSDPALLVPRTQSGLPGSQVDSDEAAGVITTRAAGEAYFSAGTNRRMFRFLAINYLCRDLEQLKDNTRPVDRVRQDVTRSPGGDSAIFHNQCSACHTGMDPMAGAFAFFEWDDTQERVVHTPGVVQDKYSINSNVFPTGYVTFDARWDNYWREGLTSNLGWRGPQSGGYGAQTLGVELASSRAFSECQVRKVFENVCFRPAGSALDEAEIQRVTQVFESQNYSMKRVFAEVAAYCTQD